MSPLSDEGSNWIRTHEQARCALGAVTQSGLLIKTRPWAGFERGYRYFGHYAVVLLVKGRGDYEDDQGNRFELKPGDMTLVFPDIGHKYGPHPGDVSHELFIVFDGPVFDSWYGAGVINTEHVRIRLGDPDTWAERLTRIIEPEASTESAALVEVTRTQEFLADALRSTEQSSAAPGRSEWIQRASRLIDKTIMGSVEWDEVAGELEVSTVTLRRRFREQLGCSPVTYRNRRIIGKACAMMQRTEMSDQAIADALGFCDPQYFSRCFKRVVGSSPRAYRARLP
ncbi:MAG: AraC family transcriptional regulator [Spirochaetales bacterium]